MVLPSRLKGNRLAGIYGPNRVDTFHYHVVLSVPSFSGKPCLIQLNTKMKLFFFFYGLHCCCDTANVHKSSSLLPGEIIPVSDTLKPFPHHMRLSGNSIALCSKELILPQPCFIKNVHKTTATPKNPRGVELIISHHCSKMWPESLNSLNTGIKFMMTNNMGKKIQIKVSHKGKN